MILVYLLCMITLYELWIVFDDLFALSENVEIKMINL